MVRSRTTSVKALTADELREEEVDVTFLVWAVARSTTDLMDATLRPSGLSGDEFAIYSMLDASSGVTPKELARWMAAPATTVSSYVKRFEGRGHLERVPHPGDRRSYRIRLSAEGRRAHARARRLFAPVRAGVVDALGPRHPAVRDALLTLRPVLDALRQAPDADDPSAGNGHPGADGGG
jgi:DNA-binding MarR family transcriptional regulator